MAGGTRVAMKRLVWKKLVGQTRVKEVLAAGFDSGTLGHAYLFCGEEGVGTLQAALELGMGLLCASSDEAPCYECESCRKVLHHAHPDFGLVFPVALARDHRSSSGALSDKGWEYIAATARERIAQPYLVPHAEGVRTVPVEWIRETNQAIQRGPLSGAAKVAVLCGVELMNKESANAMLKTLEEPPAGTTLLLCSEAPHAVLPTVQSRCQIMRFGHLSDSDIEAAVRGMAAQEPSGEQMRFVLESAQGSLGDALQLADDPQPETMRLARELWAITGMGHTLAAAQALDALVGGLDAGSGEKLLIYCMHIVRNSMVVRAGGGRFVPPGAMLLADNPESFDPYRAERLLSECRRAVRAVRARGNLALTLLNFTYRVTELLHGEEQ
ncbi:MAG: hypothetical protein GF331_06025 [Chitinivibrionales bacterium]|nr:hypothetical protein [Chitinivibrionales bacterium]